MDKIPINQRAVYFTAPGKVSVREQPLPALKPNQILVQTLLSAISPGTELLLYRGQFPPDLPLDESLAALSGRFAYPVRYGYSTVGQVIQAGSQVDASWIGRQVFAFQPHVSHFVAEPQEVFPVPTDLSPEDAAFLPNMETAVNLIMDGRPILGEHVLVFGQGIVGLLTTALLAQFPLASLVTVDLYPLRRQASLNAGASASLHPQEAHNQLSVLQPHGADLTYELSGSPQALDQAIAASGFAARVVIGSWYGQKRANLDLGGRFHRSRIQLISSQVSTLAPELSGRWDKARRLRVAWEMIRLVRPARWITQRFPQSMAEQAYQLLDQRPEETIQVLLDYADKSE